MFEGAAAEVGAFLSIASKAAALALLVRVALGFSLVQSDYFDEPIAVASEETVTAMPPAQAGLMNIADDEIASPTEKSDAALTDEGPYDHEQAMHALTNVRNFMAVLIGVIAAITCTFGNLAAYAQTNVKRLLAYSTIAHAGYMMMAVPAAIMLVNVDSEAGKTAIGAHLRRSWGWSSCP